jgi:hypothetical protein
VSNYEGVESLFSNHINVLLLQAPGNAFEAQATQYIQTSLKRTYLLGLGVVET